MKLTRKQKRTALRVLAASLLLACALVANRLFAPHTLISLVLFAAPYLVIGYDVLFKAGRNVVRGQVFDEQLLMTVATIGAFAIGEYVEACAVMLFYQVGELFQSIAVGKSRRSIAQLMSIKPESATVERDGTLCTVAPEEVAVGEIVAVRPGERVPLDGVIAEGSTSLDLSSLTGESTPVDADVGQPIPSGAINLTGLIRVQVTCRYEGSAVARILALVEEAVERKARTESFITRFARYYTPLVCIAALLLCVLPPLLGLGSFSRWLHRALVFLVVSCPCALVISVPLSFFGGIGGAARKGILIKGAEYIEALARTDVFVMDKTGTLTTGEFSITKAIPIACATEEELLRLVAACESGSTHPIAASIVATYARLYPDNAVAHAEELEELAGRGVRATVDGRKIYVGGDAMRQSLAPTLVPDGRDGTVVYVFEETDGIVHLGSIILADTPKKTASEAMSRLRTSGIKHTVMLTGDRETAACSIAAQIGIGEYRSELLPQDKVHELEELLKSAHGKGRCVAYVGDGINDAPVLARADVGIAMGALGTDAAIEAADVVIMDDELLRLPLAVRCARRTMRIVRQNIVFALSVKAVILLLGALGIAGMWIAVFGDVGVMVIAILNATRALSVPEK